MYLWPIKLVPAERHVGSCAKKVGLSCATLISFASDSCILQLFCLLTDVFSLPAHTLILSCYCEILCLGRTSLTNYCDVPSKVALL